MRRGRTAAPSTSRSRMRTGGHDGRRGLRPGADEARSHGAPSNSSPAQPARPREMGICSRRRTRRPGGPLLTCAPRRLEISRAMDRGDKSLCGTYARDTPGSGAAARRGRARCPHPCERDWPATGVRPRRAHWLAARPWEPGLASARTRAEPVESPLGGLPIARAVCRAMQRAEGGGACSESAIGGVDERR